MERKGDSAAHPFCWSTPVLENTATSKREEEETETRGNCADGNQAAAERWRLERERVYTFEGKKRRWCCNVIGERVRCPSRRTASMGHSGELYSSRPTFSPIPNVYFSSSSKPPTFLLRLFDTSPLFTTSDHDVDWTTSPEVTQPSE